VLNRVKRADRNLESDKLVTRNSVCQETEIYKCLQTRSRHALPLVLLIRPSHSRQPAQKARRTKRRSLLKQLDLASNLVAGIENGDGAVLLAAERDLSHVIQRPHMPTLLVSLEPIGLSVFVVVV